MPSSDQRLNVQERSHPCVVWLRRDLRLDDNRCLFEANKRSKGRIIPIYILDPRDYTPNLLGWPKCGAYRGQFLLEALKDLKLKLKRLGSDLVIRTGEPEEILPELANTHGATHLYTLEPQDPVEASAVRAVNEGCYREGIEFVQVEGATLYDEGRLPFEPDQLPDSFIEFRRVLEREMTPREPELAIKKILPLPMGLRPGSLPKLDKMNLTEFTPDPRSTISFMGGEAYGLKRVKDYFWDRQMLSYASQMRGVLAGEAISTKLSPWINLGCLSPRRLWYEALTYEKQHKDSQGAYSLIYKLTLRDFMIFQARALCDRLYDLNGARELPKVWEEDPNLFNCWWSGYTGFPLVDALMRELSATGYISVRGREIVTDFLVHHLKLPWTWAASCFETLLIDYHPATTNLSMQGAAGVGLVHKRRVTHPVESGYEVDWEGAYVRYWIPELANLPQEVIYQPYMLNEEYQAYYGVILGQSYPYPIIAPPPPREQHTQAKERRHELLMAKFKKLGKI